jgi:hypothetical protein
MENESELHGYWHESQLKYTKCSTKECIREYKRDGYWITETPIMEIGGIEYNLFQKLFSGPTVIMKCPKCGGTKKFKHEGGTKFSPL